MPAAAKRCYLLPLLLVALFAAWSRPAVAQESSVVHLVEAGDTWAALAWRYGISQDALRAANRHPNRFRQPVIGDSIQIPLPAEAVAQRPGLLIRPQEGMLALAVRHNLNPFYLAQLNGFPHLGRPSLETTVFLPVGEELPRELPAGFTSLELSQVPAMAGRALAYRARAQEVISATAQLNSLPWDTFSNGEHLLGLGGTGAFFPPGAAELSIVPAGGPAWSQPWRFVEDVWDYDQVTLTGEAAAIDQEAIAAERARLFTIWSQASPSVQWTGPFQLPIENYLQVSSNYGARRSYNGGPYRSYHEGVDFSAYEGTPVYAAAAGTVVLAERLYVRGGAVIIDHGLGIYSGYYHMSAVHATPGQMVQAGDIVGEVGTTGLSSGNHLHWDLLVAETWVDAAAWREQGMACWLLAGWGTPCP